MKTHLKSAEMVIRLVRSIPILAYASCVLLNTGCTIERMKPCAHPEHLVAIDSDGLLRKPDGKRLVELNEKAKQVDYKRLFAPIFNNAAFLESTNIVIFIQGGLNDLDSAVDRADWLSHDILNDTNYTGYPIFIGWNANLFSAYNEHLFKVRRGRTEPTAAKLLSPFTLVADVGHLVTRAPISTFEQAAAGIRTLRSGNYGTNKAEKAWLSVVPDVNKEYLHLQRSGFAVALGTNSSDAGVRGRSAAMLIKAVPLAAIDATVDTAGKVAWDQMLRRTKTMFVTPNYFQPGGLEVFTSSLIEHLSKHPEKRVTIIGHSMGTIVANEWILRHGDDLRISRIIYMAGACGFEDFNRCVVPFLRRHREAHFYNLCLHPANDSSESYYYMVNAGGVLMPQGSLLDWIDFYYSSTESDFGRTIGKWDNAIMGMKVIDRNLYPQISIKGFGLGDESGVGPQHHGGFDQIRFWDPRVWEPGYWNPDLVHHWSAK